MCHTTAAHHERQACGCGRRSGHAHWFEHHHYTPDPFGAGLGVRRPLRFLAWKLELDDAQVTELAAVLNELKTERAQHAVDDRRALTLLADAAQAETFDSAKAEEASRLRSESAARVQTQVAEALKRMHALLRPEQRARLAYLLRTGTLAM
jgi:Spy/CpxP family protein refolding chaperone